MLEKVDFTDVPGPQPPIQALPGVNFPPADQAPNFIPKEPLPNFTPAPEPVDTLSKKEQEELDSGEDCKDPDKDPEFMLNHPKPFDPNPPDTTIGPDDGTHSTEPPFPFNLMDQENDEEPHIPEDGDKEEGPVFDAPGLPPIGGFGGISSNEPDGGGDLLPGHHLDKEETTGGGHEGEVDG